MSRFPFKSGTGDIDFFATLLVTENSVAMKIKEKKCKGKAFNLNRMHEGKTLTIGTSLDYLFPYLRRFFSCRIFPVFPNLKSKINTSKFWCRWQLETLINDVSFVFKKISMIEAINRLNSVQNSYFPFGVIKCAISALFSWHFYSNLILEKKLIPGNNERTGLY